MGVSETRVREIGEDLLRRMAGQKPGLFDKAWWSGQILEWAMRDEVFKTEMFRFVDVFPVLDSPDEIGRHIREYLLRPGVNPPTVIKLALKGAGLGKLAGRVAAGQIAKNLEGMAKNFIVGVDAAGALGNLTDLRRQRQAFTVDLLGEAVVSEVEAEHHAERYRQLIEELAAQSRDWAEDPLLDQDDRGPIPRVNVSIKLSAMSSRLDALDFEGSVDAAAARLRPLFVTARDRGVFVNVDMEQYALKDLTLATFKRVLEHPELRGFEDAGIVVQAYLRDAEADLKALHGWARKQRRRITVRLVKGAYWDYETVQAEREGWPSPVWLDKGDADLCFDRCAEFMLANHKHLRSAVGSHNARSLAFAMAAAEQYKVPLSGYEIQCLYGMAEPIEAACIERGHRVRVYAPIGELIPGMAYLVRRLLENTSNQSWLRLGFAEDAAADVLLAAPRGRGRGPMLRAVPPRRTSVDGPGEFVNEPLRDFVRGDARAAFGRALGGLRLGAEIGPEVGGAPRPGAERRVVEDPATGEAIGRARLATVDEAEAAVTQAFAAFPAWRDRPARDRADLLFALAAELRADRDALSALMVREVGKPWREADADTCEAIDFCEYYAREALRLAAPQPMQRLPGEQNHLSYLGRGVTAVIAPWNFPLAILTGLMAAPLVTGNPVILKPAEQSLLVAARLYALARKAGFPGDVLHFLPARGETVGAHLVSHPEVANIAFTGSRAVGLAIYRGAGVTHPGQPGLKRVVCEMGGKNAVIVDRDADLDEAVQGVLRSAFGFAGQKCSACSRVIVLDGVHDLFVERLVEATRSLKVCAPTDPGCDVGPVIDAESRARLEAAIAAGERSATLRITGETPQRGHFVGPTIFTDVAPDDPLAQTELFGPVLAVLRAKDIDQALAWANGTEYALTGGVFSRSPATIERVRRELLVGNLYINRTITGAIVGRQPFGGAALSGGGTKAGGPDYLLNFVNPRVITENTLRRGFAPEA